MWAGFAGFWLLETPLSLPFLQERGAPASEETSAKWVIGNGKWGEGWRQGLGQEVHGHVCSGINREKRGVGKRVIKKAIQELQKNRKSQK